MATHGRGQRTVRKPALKFPHLQKKLRTVRSARASKKIRQRIATISRPYISPRQALIADQ
jgi:hypothetical protein